MHESPTVRPLMEYIVDNHVRQLHPSAIANIFSALIWTLSDNGERPPCYDQVVRPVEAQYQDGILRPLEPLSLRPGERVNLIVVRRSDPKRWDLVKLAQSASQEDVDLAECGLAEWESSLDAMDRS